MSVKFLRSVRVRSFTDATGLRSIRIDGFPCSPAQRTTNGRLISHAIDCFVESHHRPRGNAHSSHRRFLLSAHTCARRCTVISIRTLTPRICGSRVVTTMLMEISVYPFDYQACRRARFVGARKTSHRYVGDDNNENLYIVSTINGNCPTRESDINIPVCTSIAT